jgi:hypothetical protein
MQFYTLLFDPHEEFERRVDIVAAWDAGLMTHREMHLLAALFFENFTDELIGKVCDMNVADVNDMWGAEGLAPRPLGVALTRLARNIGLIQEQALKNRKLIINDEGRFARDEDAIHALDDVLHDIVWAQFRCDEISDSFEQRAEYLLLFKRLLGIIIPGTIMAGYQPQRFADMIGKVQDRVRGR